MNISNSSCLEVFRYLAGVDLPEVDQLARFTSQCNLKAGERLFHSAEHKPFVYSVNRGVVKQVEYRALQQLADQYIEWQRAISNAFKFYGQRKEQREMELLTLSPEERYLNFIQQYAHLLPLIKQRDIASYIRITPVALSRIRARIKASGKVSLLQK